MGGKLSTPQSTPNGTASRRGLSKATEFQTRAIHPVLVKSLGELVMTEDDGTIGRECFYATEE